MLRKSKGQSSCIRYRIFRDGEKTSTTFDSFDDAKACISFMAWFFPGTFFEVQAYDGSQKDGKVFRYRVLADGKAMGLSVGTRHYAKYRIKLLRKFSPNTVFTIDQYEKLHWWS